MRSTFFFAYALMQLFLSISRVCCVHLFLCFKLEFKILILLLYSTSEIPGYRLPYDAVNFEIDLMKHFGVNHCCCSNRKIGASIFVLSA